MPTRRSSSTTAGAVFLNKQERIAELRAAAERAASALPHLQRIVLCGSMATGVPTPRSDADLLVIVGTSAFPQMRDRIPEMLAALSPLPCPVDVIVLTSDELDRGRAASDPLLREALTTGIDLV